MQLQIHLPNKSSRAIQKKIAVIIGSKNIGIEFYVNHHLEAFQNVPKPL